MENSNRARTSYNPLRCPPPIPRFCGFVPPCCSPSQGARRARCAPLQCRPSTPWEAPMSAKHLVLILVLAAGAITAVYATRYPAPEEALPAAEGEIPRIVIVARREHAADQQH